MTKKKVTPATTKTKILKDTLPLPGTDLHGADPYKEEYEKAIKAAEFTVTFLLSCEKESIQEFLKDYPIVCFILRAIYFKNVSWDDLLIILNIEFKNVTVEDFSNANKDGYLFDLFDLKDDIQQITEKGKLLLLRLGAEYHGIKNIQGKYIQVDS